MNANLESVKSFRDRWMAFVTVCDDLRLSGVIDQEKERAFQSARISLVKRFQELRDGDIGRDAPPRLVDHLEAIRGYESISSLSDTQLNEMKSLIAKITEDLDRWLESHQRKRNVRSFLAHGKRVDALYAFLVIPFLFVVLVVALALLGMRIFFTR